MQTQRGVGASYRTGWGCTLWIPLNGVHIQRRVTWTCVRCTAGVCLHTQERVPGKGWETESAAHCSSQHCAVTWWRCGWNHTVSSSNTRNGSFISSAWVKLTISPPSSDFSPVPPNSDWHSSVPTLQHSCWLLKEGWVWRLFSKVV